MSRLDRDLIISSLLHIAHMRFYIKNSLKNKKVNDEIYEYSMRSGHNLLDILSKLDDQNYLKETFSRSPELTAFIHEYN